MRFRSARGTVTLALPGDRGTCSRSHHVSHRTAELLRPSFARARRAGPAGPLSKPEGSTAVVSPQRLAERAS
jgi:hypothetical protein